MSESNRIREVVPAITPDYLKRRQEAGWRLHAVEWLREGAPEPGEPLHREELPYGVQIAGDCLHLEENPYEMRVLVTMTDLIVDDTPLSGVASALNGEGLRTRRRTPWAPGDVFNLLPRMIEAGPRLFTREEWVRRRGRLMQKLG
ncbi:MAG: hypothetical protein FJW40_00440 [Acidobacteria bacterium]|nr:hypothetical protein [Acidobacteriota bacterium]